MKGCGTAPQWVKNMKKRILSVLAVLLVFAALFSSCGAGNLAFSKLVRAGSAPEEAPLFTKAELMDISGTFQSAAGGLAYFQRVTTMSRIGHEVYNLTTGKLLWEGENGYSDEGKFTYSVHLKSYAQSSCFYISKSTDISGTLASKSHYTLYDQDGKAVASGENNGNAPVFCADLVIFGGVVYRLENGELNVLHENADLMRTPSSWEKAGMYYCGYSSNTLYIYNDNLSLRHQYQLPGYAKNISRFVLNNGNVLIQYSVLCDPYTQSYTYLSNNQKYKLVTLLFDAQKGGCKKLDCSWFLEDVQRKNDRTSRSYFEENGISYDLSNILTAYAIKDKQVDQARAYMFALDNDGKIKDAIDGYVPGTVSSMSLVAQNRWLVKNTAGHSYLLDQTGTILGECSAANRSSVGVLSGSNTLYDWDLNKLADFSEYGTSTTLLHRGALVTKENGEATLWTKQGVKTLIDEEQAQTRSVQACGAFGYAVMETSEQLSNARLKALYNDKGELLFSDENNTIVNISVAYSDDACSLICLQHGSGSFSYLLLS